MKRALIISGPESSGNRLLASIFIAAGCKGQASKNQRWNYETPTNGSPICVVRSMPHGPKGMFEEYRRWGFLANAIIGFELDQYDVDVIVPVRHPVAVAKSQRRAGHVGSHEEGLKCIRLAYETIFDVCLGRGIVPTLVSYESLILGGLSAVNELLVLKGFEKLPILKLEIEGLVVTELRDENKKHLAGN